MKKRERIFFLLTKKPNFRLSPTPRGVERFGSSFFSIFIAFHELNPIKWRPLVRVPHNHERIVFQCSDLFCAQWLKRRTLKATHATLAQSPRPNWSGQQWLLQRVAMRPLLGVAVGLTTTTRNRRGQRMDHFFWGQCLRLAFQRKREDIAWSITLGEGEKTHGDFLTLRVSFLIGGNVSPTRIRLLVFSLLHFGTKICAIKITESPFFCRVPILTCSRANSPLFFVFLQFALTGLAQK